MKIQMQSMKVSLFYYDIIIKVIIDAQNHSKQALDTHKQFKNKRKVMKKVKQKVIKVDAHGNEKESEEEVDVEVEENESDQDLDQNEFYKEKSIVFEDEKFNQEKGEALLSFNQFQPFLEDFIHENIEYVLLDTNNEFEDFNQQDKKYRLFGTSKRIK